MPENTNPFYEASLEVGDGLYEDKKEAIKVGERVTPFGMRRITPSEFRREQNEGGEKVRKATLERLAKEKGGQRQGAKEYLRMMGKVK